MGERHAQVVWNVARTRGAVDAGGAGPSWVLRAAGVDGFVGQRWDTFDAAPWNLSNVWWRAGRCARRGGLAAQGQRKGASEQSAFESVSYGVLSRTCGSRSMSMSTWLACTSTGQICRFT